MKFLTIGNITKDLLRTKEKEEYTFGGTSYCGITAAKLGCKSIILSRGNDELSEWLKYLNSEGAEVILQQDKNVAYFVNDYRSGERKQFLLNNTEKIEFDIGDVGDIGDIGEKFDVIHVNPMFREVNLDLFKKIRKQCNILSLDIQGLVRDVKGKQVVGRFWEEREKFLPFVDLLKIGKNEIVFISKLSKLRDYKKNCEELSSLGAKIIEITCGIEGSWVYDDKLYNIQSFRTKTVDETGAGDVYATSFAIKYFETKDVLESAMFASAAASFVVEDFGTKNIATRSDVEKRAKILRESEKLF